MELFVCTPPYSWTPHQYKIPFKWNILTALCVFCWLSKRPLHRNDIQVFLDIGTIVAPLLFLKGEFKLLVKHPFLLNKQTTDIIIMLHCLHNLQTAVQEKTNVCSVSQWLKRLQNLQFFDTNQCFQVLACSSYQVAWEMCGAILWLTRIHTMCKLEIILVKVIEVN